MQSLVEFRKAANLTLEQFAVSLGLSGSSKGHLSRIENGERAPLRLALKIQRATKGAVPATSLVSDDDRDLLVAAPITPQTRP